MNSIRRSVLHDDAVPGNTMERINIIEQHRPNLNKLLEKAYNRQTLTWADIVYLLELKDKNDIGSLFHTARALRNKYFSNKVYLYGFVYFSTWCRNDCAFCYYRNSNERTERYRRSTQEILEAAASLADSGVHLVDLTMGEDPFYYQKHGGASKLINIVRQVQRHTQLPLMASPGVVSEKIMGELSSAGADFYACYQETHNRQLFNRLRFHQSYEERYSIKKIARKNGLLIEEGIMTGIGETVADIAQSISSMQAMNAHQVRVMSFVPQKGSPMSDWPAPDRINELKVIAVLRLVMPDRLIPASLDVDGLEGLQARLNAGANVVSSLIPPGMGFAGVAQTTKDINRGSRTVQGVMPIIERLGLAAATLEEYTNWITIEKNNLLPQANAGIG